MNKTVLYDEHLSLGAKMVDFYGFLMPVSYTSILKEHESVRNHCGVFDISHMGEFLVKGPNSLVFLESICTNNISRSAVNDAIYTCMCYENGNTVDDMIIYRLSEDEFFCVVNASNIKKDLEWMISNNQHGAVIQDISPSFAQLAVQGPMSEKLITDVFPDLAIPSFFKCVRCDEYLISRTGYTGEDGFEIYLKDTLAVDLWHRLLKKGKKYLLSPIGLGARDTLRFEACLPLYGHEISEEISPLEAGLARFVKLDKPFDFIGKRSLVSLSKKPGRIQIGMEMAGGGIPREGYDVLHNGVLAGYVTSGSFCPTLNTSCALAIIDSNLKDVTDFKIKIRDKLVSAKKIKTPFYKKNIKKQEVYDEYKKRS